MPLVGRIWCFHGRVQGVGFRARTCQLATAFPVAGSVMNLPDGTVEVQAWSDPETLDQFLDAILRELGPYIRDRTTAALPATAEPPIAFRIRY